MTRDMSMDIGIVIKGLASKWNPHEIAVFLRGVDAKSLLNTYKVSVIILTLLTLITGVYIGTLYTPMTERNRKESEELDKLIVMQNQIPVLNTQIETAKTKLNASKAEYIAILAHFGNSEDLGSLYQTVSALAEKYNMVVLTVKEITPKPVPAKPQPKAKPENTDKKIGDTTIKAPATKEVKKTKVDVQEIEVAIELQGRYPDYIRFKEDLALAEILLKVNSESVMVKDEKSEQGNIYVKLNLTTYAIDKKPFQGIITEQANEKSH